MGVVGAIVGDIVGDAISGIVETTTDVVGNIGGIVLGGLLGTGSGSGSSYTPGPSITESHARKIADELADMKKNVRESCERSEQAIIGYINKSMDDLIHNLDIINKQTYGGKSLNINIKGIKEKKDSLKREVIGCIGNKLDERLVLTDSELSVILEERDDKKRAKNFDSFCIKIKNQALSDLSRKIETTVRKQEEMIRKEIQSRLDEVDKSMKDALEAYNEILSIKDQDDAKMKEMQMKYIYKYELTNIVMDQLEG